MMASHYLGYAQNERTRTQRIEHHLNGTAGVAITRAAFERGIEMVVGWLGEGSQDDERRMKQNGNHHRRCVICKAERLQESLERITVVGS
jgi:hypothetical protein